MDTSSDLPHLPKDFPNSQETYCLLLACHTPGASGKQVALDTLTELSELVQNIGFTPIHQVLQASPHPHPKTYLGSGKLNWLAEALNHSETSDAAEEEEDCEKSVERFPADAEPEPESKSEPAWEVFWEHLQVVVVDDELSPVQQRQLEQTLKRPVLDRTEIILRIFAQRAKSREGKLQVELARLQYELPRLRGKGLMLSQQTAAGKGSGVTATRGPGETQLELDKRWLRHRITMLKKEVKAVKKHRQRQRQRRQKGTSPLIALVGYTNAGKSTLLNRLTQANTEAVDQLFATLDPLTRQCYIPEVGQVLMTDTVGFIRKLPTQLIDAFQSTLEVITEADVILHVWDVSHPLSREHWHTVEETLDKLEATEQPRLTLMNKMDLTDPATADTLQAEFLPHPAVQLSAKTGKGLDALNLKLADCLMAVTPSRSIPDPPHRC